jgi:hypothetical protein
VYFALHDIDTRTPYDAPKSVGGLEEVLSYARILIRDGKIKARERGDKNAK